MAMPLFIARQARRPTGLLGHIVARVMAWETAPEDLQTLDLLDIRPGDQVLEIGCGHGRTLHKAARRADGVRITGIDFSDVMVRVAERRNRRFISAGRVTIDRADSASLRYGDDTFTKVYSVNTIYFWEHPEVQLREIYRVLAAGGHFVLGFRPGDDPDFSAQFPTAVYRMRTAAEVEAIVADAGFDKVRMVTRRVGKHAMRWAVAHKAAGRPDQPGNPKSK